MKQYLTGLKDHHDINIKYYLYNYISRISKYLKFIRSIIYST